MMPTERLAMLSEQEAERRWWSWVSRAVRDDVRCDVSLTGLPLLIDYGEGELMLTVVEPLADRKVVGR